MESRATTRNKSALYSDLSRTLATTLSSTSTAANSKVLKQRELRYNKLSSLNSNVNNSTSSGMNVLGTSRVTTTANTDFEAAVICPIAVFQQTPYSSSISSATVNINTNTNTNTTYTHATSLSASTKKPKNRDSQDFELDFDAMANTKNILSSRMKKIPKGVQAVYIGTTLQEKIKRKNTKKTKKLVFTKKFIYSYLDEYINDLTSTTGPSTTTTPLINSASPSSQQPQDSSCFPVTLLTCTPKPSKYPPRHSCCICGFVFNCAGYCNRCGNRYCSKECYKMHIETRCVKFLV